MTETFGYNPLLHDGLRWSVVKDGKRWDRSFNSEAAAWRALRCMSWVQYTLALSPELVEWRKQQGYSVVPIAWSYKK